MSIRARVLTQRPSATPHTWLAFQNLGNTYFWYHNPSDSFQIFGDVVKVWGNHTLKFGADVRQYRMSYFNTGNSTGTFAFGSSWTNGPFSNSAAAPLGQEFAAFLLGLPSSGSYDLNTFRAVQSAGRAYVCEPEQPGGISDGIPHLQPAGRIRMEPDSSA